jgi:hypothetical protein
MAWTKPGALGGSPPETYIGQAFGPFLLPCHKHVDFEDPNWKQKVNKTPQCAGAAMFREAMGISDRLPKQIYRLKPEGPLLENPLEFYAHHKQITFHEALLQLIARPPRVLLQEQLERRSNIYFDMENKDE